MWYGNCTPSFLQMMSLCFIPHTALKVPLGFSALSIYKKASHFCHMHSQALLIHYLKLLSKIYRLIVHMLQALSVMQAAYLKLFGYPSGHMHS
jgi:hypothetical protein